MMRVLKPLQDKATTGAGKRLVLPEPRRVRFLIRGEGSVSAGAVTIECCPESGETSLVAVHPASDGSCVPDKVDPIPAMNKANTNPKRRADIAVTFHHYLGCSPNFAIISAFVR